MAGKAKRLNKAAKEYNVSITTIVDFLATKGFEIDSKPTTKIEGEILDALEKEYADDKLAKENSKKAAVTREKRESISLKDVKPTEEKPVEEVTEDFNVANFKENTPIEKVVKKTEKTEEVEETKPEKTVEPKAKEKEKEVEKEIIGDGDVKVAVVGKIDLSSINQKTRPDKKKKEVKKEKTPQKPATKKVEEVKPVIKEDPEKSAEIKTIKATSDTLTGPKVVGKIVLPVEKKKEKKETLQCTFPELEGSYIKTFGGYKTFRDITKRKQTYLNCII